MAVITIHDTSFEYLEKGRGTPLVLVHGSASDYRTWHFQLKDFAGGFRAIAYSRRYHWPNKPITEEKDYSMREQVLDLRELLYSLDAAPAHLVGHSYGAFLCLLLAIKEPGSVRSLVLAEPPVVTLFVSNQPKPSEILKLLLTRPRTALEVIKFGAKGIKPATEAARRGAMEEAMRIFGRAVLGDEFYARLSEERLAEVKANSIKAEFLGSGFAPLDAEAVRNVQKPVLLVTGEKSPPLFHRLTDRLEQLLPRSERVEIKDASHIMHEDNPADFNQQALSFLTRAAAGDQKLRAERENVARQFLI